MTGVPPKGGEQGRAGHGRRARMPSPTFVSEADRLGVCIVFEVRHVLLGYQLVSLVRVVVESKVRHRWRVGLS